MESSEIGLRLSRPSGFEPLGRSLTSAADHIVGRRPCFQDCRVSSRSETSIASPPLFSIQGRIPSTPGALLSSTRASADSSSSRVIVLVISGTLSGGASTSKFLSVGRCSSLSQFRRGRSRVLPSCAGGGWSSGAPSPCLCRVRCFAIALASSLPSVSSRPATSTVGGRGVRRRKSCLIRLCNGGLLPVSWWGRPASELSASPCISIARSSSLIAASS